MVSVGSVIQMVTQAFSGSFTQFQTVLIIFCGTATELSQRKCLFSGLFHTAHKSSVDLFHSQYVSTLDQCFLLQEPD